MLTNEGLDALLGVQGMPNNRNKQDRYEVEARQIDNGRTDSTRWDTLEQALAHARRHRAIGIRAVQYFSVVIRDRSKDEPEQVVWTGGPDVHGKWVETAVSDG